MWYKSTKEEIPGLQDILTWDGFLYNNYCPEDNVIKSRFMKERILKPHLFDKALKLHLCVFIYKNVLHSGSLTLECVTQALLVLKMWKAMQSSWDLALCGWARLPKERAHLQGDFSSFLKCWVPCDWWPTKNASHNKIEVVGALNVCVCAVERRGRGNLSPLRKPRECELV